MTAKQLRVYNYLNQHGPQTVRGLADKLETKQHRKPRFSDDEVRGLLERLEKDGHVSQLDGDPVRYQVTDKGLARGFGDGGTMGGGSLG